MSETRPHEHLCSGGLCFASDETEDCACWCHSAPPRVAEVERFTEWRVTGQPNPVRGVEFPSYDFTWSERDFRDAEAKARAFVAGITRASSTVGPWLDGPHLHRRTVTRTAWEPVGIAPAPDRRACQNDRDHTGGD